MKKACVISSYAYIDKNINYGALLQYYALEKALNQIGVQSYWLRFCLPDTKKLVYRAKHMIKNIINLPHSIAYCKCLNSFKDFISKYCHESNHIYYSEQELKNKCPKADIYITGSDQVWGGTLSPNYLTYVPDDFPKISYAASFGKNQISEEHKNTIRPWLERFDAISVREDSGVDICKSMGIDAVQVLDPTLLIDAKEYPTIDNVDCPDIYGYFLNFDGLDQIYWQEILNYANDNQFRLKVACVNQTFYKYPKKYRDLPSPEEWLTKYSKAKYIFTNTFHGTVFAIIFHRPFLVIKQKGEGAKQNGRVASLLKSLGLEDRYFDDKRSIEEQVNQNIDWGCIDERLRYLRESSYGFLYNISDNIIKADS